MQKRTIIISLALVAVISASAGWLGSELSKADYIAPGESIAGCWTTHVTLLTRADGEKQDPDGVVTSARYALEALSLGLALHYDTLPSEARARIAPFVPRADVALEGHKPDPEAVTAVDCLERALESGKMDPECIAASVKRT